MDLPAFNKLYSFIKYERDQGTSDSIVNHILLGIIKNCIIYWKRI